MRVMNRYFFYCLDDCLKSIESFSVQVVQIRKSYEIKKKKETNLHRIKLTISYNS